MRYQSKKAQLGQLQAIILSLIIIGIILYIAFVILEEVGEVVDYSNTTLVSNESHNVTSATDVNLNDHARRGFKDMTIIHVINQTSPETIIPTTNYTYDADEGTIIAIDCPTGIESCMNETFWNVTYNYTYLTGYTEAFKGSNTTIQAIAKVPAWLSLIVLISIIGIVLAIIFNVLPGLPETRTSGGTGIKGKVKGMRFGGGGDTTAEI